MSAYLASGAAAASIDLDIDLDLSKPASRPARHLHAVPRTRRRPRLAYAIVAVAGALTIAAVQIVLSIATIQGVYEESALRQEARELGWQQQSLADSVTGLNSPQYLAANAASLGMVINQSPTYLRLSDGAVLGSGEAAGWISTVDAIGRGLVANSLVVNTPLVTAPDATISGAPVEVVPEAANNGLPQPLTDGLPTPTTR